MKKLITAILLLMLLLTVCAAAECAFIHIQNGDKGNHVLLLQQALIQKGYLEGEADGKFGEGTASALKRFQKSAGLPETGIADVATINALEPMTEPITKGTESLRAYVVQDCLRAWGFFSDEADGAFGNNSMKAFKVFMKYADSEMAQYRDAEALANAETVDDVATDELPDVADLPVVTEENVVTDGDVDQHWYTFMTEAYDPVHDMVWPGDSGENVRRIQTRLMLLGYLAKGNDGTYGEITSLCIAYFQRRNGLVETGNVDSATQQALYSEDATRSDQYVSKYLAHVICKKHRVDIYKWDGTSYSKRVKSFECSTGADRTPTELGTFQAAGQAGEWHEMTGCWVRYAFRIESGYYFHSVLYAHKGDSKPTNSSVHSLGSSVSHGCVRLATEDAKWIYENCSIGMTVIIE